MAWVELIAVILAAGVGCWGGRRLGGRRGWWAAAALCAAVLAGVFVGHRWVRLSFVFPWSWLVNAWANPVILGASLGMLMTLVMVRVPQVRLRRLMAALSVMVVIYAALWPQMTVLAVRPSLRHIRTHFDSHGVCLQSRNYTCGPASAVTCLRLLQVPADEGKLALAAQCRPPIGIEGQLLAAAITRLYGNAGISARYCLLDSAEGAPVPWVACMKTAGGHDVAVLHVAKDAVLVGNPSRGLQRMAREDFDALWTGAAVVVRVTPP